MADDPRRYSKHATSLDEQIALYEGRGLLVPDRDKAKHYLEFIGYYRLGGYTKSLQAEKNDDTHRFRDGATFDGVLDLYIFDRKFRNLLMDALERIEIAVKARITFDTSVNKGPFWLLDKNNFNYGRHHKILRELDRVVGDDPTRSNHRFITHYYQNYDEPKYPPSWMMMEALTFGAVSRFYNLMKGDLQKPIASAFNMHWSVLESHLHSLTYIRNLCAHHDVVWNRILTIRPKIMKSNREKWPPHSHNKIFVICGIIRHFLTIIADGSQWPQRLEALIEEHPNVDPRDMGFPADWVTRL